jgi:uncharacterized protein (DUF58 family)
MRRFLRERAAEWVRRRQGPDELPVMLHRRRLYLLPTRAGVGFAALLLMMLLAGLNYGNSLALFLTFLLGGFVIVTMHQSHRNLLGVRIAGITPQPGFAGEKASLHVTLENDSSISRYRIEAAALEKTSTRGELSPGAREHLTLDIPATRRGRVRIDRMRISSTHPFGLFRTWTWVHAPIELIVYPRPHGTLPLPTESGDRHGSIAPAATGSDEWMGLRPFRDGDSPRQVAWKAYARGTPLLVKEYGAAGSDIRLFDFSRLASLPTEARLEQLARWVVDAEARGERYGLILPGESIAPDRGPQHRHRCLAALALHGL